MQNVQGEPAEVWLSDGRPVRFVWRGRLFTVLSIVERPPARQPRPSDPWLCWRVLASPGKNIPPAHYRLCHDTARDRWLLTRWAPT